MDLSVLIKKLGHHLVEIRVRALGSLKCKLDHGLIHLSDLVQQKTLFILLLEWFNFHEVPEQEAVLELLNRLVKHSSAAHLLEDVGASEFLSRLRPNVEPKLQTTIDSILDGLFQLPEISPEFIGVSFQKQSVPTKDGKVIYHMPNEIVSGCFPSSDTMEHSEVLSQRVSDIQQVQDENVPIAGYFHNISENVRQSEVIPQRIAVNGSVKCLKFTTFPWLALTTTDKHILSSNESSLRSKNPNLIRTTCELLQDVIMQDFPPEIFIQRPKIVQNLLSLLDLTRDGTEYLTFQAVACLYQLCVNLRNRLHFYRDPNFYSSKQDTLSQSSSVSYSQETRCTQNSHSPSPIDGSPRPSVIGRTGQRARGDGQDGDAMSSSRSSSQGDATSRFPANSPLDNTHLDLSEIETEALLQLQLQQLTLAQFSVSVLEHAVPLLRSENMKSVFRILELLSVNIVLVEYSVSESVWSDDSLIAWELKEKLLSSHESLADTLNYFYTKINSDIPESTLIQLRMSYIGTAIFTIRLLQTLLPVEKACDVLTENMGTALFFLSMDMSFSMTFPNIHESVVSYMEQINPENVNLYKKTSHLVYSIDCTCNFIKETKREKKNNLVELLDLADHALESLPYHQYLHFVKEVISICSHIWKSAQASPVLQAESQKVYLRLISHPVTAIKLEAYTCTLNTLKECLGIHNITMPVSAICHEIHFLLHGRVLYEICAFGLQDSAQQVSSTAKEIMIYLLQGRLIMASSSWNRFMEALNPVVSILQGYASTDETLGKCVLLLSETAQESGDSILTRTARLYAALRLLFIKQKKVRATAVKQLTWHLTNEEGANKKRPHIEGSLLASLVNLFVVDQPIDLKLDTEKSFFKVDCVGKVYHIFTSETVDMPLRKSAVEQLVIIMQDSTMHDALKSLGAVEKILQVINECIDKNGKGLESLLLPCVSLLRKLVYADPILRHSLAQEPSNILLFLRASLIIMENKGCITEAASLMCLLLFDEVARTDIWTDDSSVPFSVPPPPFTLPATVIGRYCLPFRVASHHVASPYCVLMPPHLDSLTRKPSWNMLKFAWNRAWYDGIENLLQNHQNYSEEFLESLKMAPAECLLLKVTHVITGLQDCLDTINGAASHGIVSSSLTRMRFYFLNDRLAKKIESDSCKYFLESHEWHNVMSRFLQVLPSCLEDEKLLIDILRFLNTYFKHAKMETDCKDLLWFLEMETNPLMSILIYKASNIQSGSEDIQAVISQRVQKELITFFNTLLHCLTSVTDRRCLALAGPFRTQLAVKLLQCLRISDAPHFYGLPSLERTLKGMIHVTALSGWSLYSPAEEPDSLCIKYLNGLLEVISSFYVEWGGNSLSFMGKGVTKSAVLCLLQLSHEMMAQTKSKDWVSLWSLAYDQNHDEQPASHLGLAWLIPLWVDRDPEVRFASLAIGSALTSVENGCVALGDSCQNISGGLWGTVLSILLDQSESSAVRREAAFILQNLFTMPMSSNNEESKDFVWQSPCVHDEESGLSLVGLPALQALLCHCQFFEHASQAIKNCYIGRHSFDLTFFQVTSNVLNKTEDLDSLKSWGAVPSPLNQSEMSYSLCTSSTLILPEGIVEIQPSVPLVSRPDNPDAPRNRMITQGQSDTETSSVHTIDSQISGLPLDHCVIVTPTLVSALCGMLSNLLAILPEFTFTALKDNNILASLTSLVDASFLGKCLQELRSPIFPDDKQDIKAQVTSLLQYISAFASLLQSSVTVNAKIMFLEDILKPLVENMFALFSPHHINNTDEELTSALYDTWISLFMLLTTVLRKSCQAAFPSVMIAVEKYWTSYTGAISTCVELSNENALLCTSALQFFSVLLSEEARQQLQDLTEMRTVQDRTLTKLLNSTSGSKLCELLLKIFDGRSSNDVLKKVIANAVMSLLAVSPAAQKHALQAGLIDSCVEQIKQCHAHLTLDLLTLERTTQKKKFKQEDNLIRELKLCIHILRNCLYQNDECKIAATDAHLVSTLHSLWPWFILDDSLMQAALQLLCVYTANSPQACATFSWSSGGPSSAQRGGPSSNSLMHNIMKLASKKCPENSSIQQLAFALLSNLVISHECKGLLQKSNFLQSFVSLSLPKPGSKNLSPIVNLWLKLLLNMSFSEDGQQMIQKTNGALEFLTEISQCNPRNNKSASLLILHNICFSSSNKPKVLINDKTVEVLSSCLESSFLDTQTIGASALWALLYNNQKAKVTLKNPVIKRRVDEALTLCRKDADKLNTDVLNSYKMKCLENISQLLNS
ncbi:rotatin [Polypterus senegalus]|uniref:rotatin n=1 Tax=Polypterus senegalus TaxID=55291 RepID=UPI00196319EA|nr:rotatin [Polypterus senegalus]